MTLLTSAFWLKVLRGHKRSLEVKNYQKRSNFELGLNVINYISKWRYWRKLSDERCLEVLKINPRSKIEKRSNFKLWREVTRGHLGSRISNKSQILIFFKIRQTIPQKAFEQMYSKKNLVTPLIRKLTSRASF